MENNQAHCDTDKIYCNSSNRALGVSRQNGDRVGGAGCGSEGNIGPLHNKEEIANSACCYCCVYYIPVTMWLQSRLLSNYFVL